MDGIGIWLEVDMDELLESDDLYDVYCDSGYYVVQNSVNGFYRILTTDPEDCEELQDCNIWADDVSVAYVIRFFEKLADHSLQTFNPD